MDKLLVIDDMFSNVEMIRNTFGKRYDIRCIDDQADFIGTCRDFRPDIILLDVLMPKRDGFDICREIRRNRQFDEIPIIFITSRDDVSDVVTGFESGGQDYVTRPFYTEELIERIKTHIELKKSKERLNEYAKKLEEKNRELEKMSHIDYLTGISNRRHMISRMNEEAARASQKNEIFSFLLCDLDHFKRINDTLGHEAGDTFIKKAAELIVQNLRKEDVAARWGGEEFLVMLPDTDKQIAREMAERIRQAIEQYEGEYKEQKAQITITIGISEYSPKLSLEENITHADDALFEGKRNGRNRIVVY